MNDVNLNSPDLKLVRTSDQAPARASVASPLNEGSNASAQPVTSPVVQSVAQKDQGNLAVQRVEDRQKAQREALGEAVSQLNDYVQNVQRDLQFEVDNELGKTIVKVVDQTSKEVIRQIPDEVALRLAERLQQEEPLTLFNAKV